MNRIRDAFRLLAGYSTHCLLVCLACTVLLHFPGPPAPATHGWHAETLRHTLTPPPPLTALSAAPELAAPVSTRASRADDNPACIPAVTAFFPFCSFSDTPVPLPRSRDIPLRLPAERGFIFFSLPPPAHPA